MQKIDDTITIDLDDIIQTCQETLNVVKEHGIGHKSLFNEETGNVCFLGGIGHAAQRVAHSQGFGPFPDIKVFKGLADLPAPEDAATHLASQTRKFVEPLVPSSIPSWNDGLEVQATENVIARLQAAVRNLKEYQASVEAGEGDEWTLDAEFCLTNNKTGESFPIPEVEMVEYVLAGS